VGGFLANERIAAAVSFALARLIVLLAILCAPFDRISTFSDQGSVSRAAGTRSELPAVGFLPQSSPEIWFAPLAAVQRPEIGGGAVDYMRLFDQPSSWPTASSYVHVFALGPNFVRVASDDDLSTVFGWLKRHHIALAFGIGLIRPRAGCRRTEGFDDDHEALARRIQRLGGNLTYLVAMSPVYFGHASNQPGACRLPIDTLTADAASSAKVFQRLFPDVRIVEDEPISNFQNADWIEQIGQFQTAFQRAYGRPIRAVRLDIAWWEPWEARALAITRYLRQIGKPVGVIYNGNEGDASDADWLNNARRHYRAYEHLVGGAPAQAVFESWVHHPTHLLPEHSPSAFTNLIIEYHRSHRSVR